MEIMKNRDLDKFLGMVEIKGERKPCIFNKIPKDLIGEYIFPFFAIKEAKELGKLNKLFRYCFGLRFTQFVKDWKKRLFLLKDKFNLEVPEDQIDSTELQAIKNKRFYTKADHPENAIQFTDIGKFRYVGIYNRITWSHVDNGKYYSKIQFSNGFDGKTTYLKEVCWLDCKMTMFEIPKGNYKLKLRHSFQEADLKSMLTVYAGEKKIFQMDYPDKEMAKKIKKNPQKNYGEMDEEDEDSDDIFGEDTANSEPLFDSKICKIREEDFTDAKEDIRVEINHKELCWKFGWSIDSLFLEPFEKSC